MWYTVQYTKKCLMLLADTYLTLQIQRDKYHPLPHLCTKIGNLLYCPVQKKIQMEHWLCREFSSLAFSVTQRERLLWMVAHLCIQWRLRKRHNLWTARLVHENPGVELDSLIIFYNSMKRCNSLKQWRIRLGEGWKYAKKVKVLNQIEHKIRMKVCNSLKH